MDIPVIVCAGLTGGEYAAGKVRLKQSEVGAASDKFASTYILKMGLHYDRYVVGGHLPSFLAVPRVYTAGGLAAMATKKGRASSVTGNIGECIASIVARRKLKAKKTGDVLPVIAPQTAKAPDYIMRFRPMFPHSFQQATGAYPKITFAAWPVESKAAGTDNQGRSQVRAALQQLGTFWYERFPFERSVAGFGVAVCLLYRQQPNRLIRVHVFVPSNQAGLHTHITRYRASNDRSGFLHELATPNSLVRDCIHALD